MFKSCGYSTLQVWQSHIKAASGRRTQKIGRQDPCVMTRAGWVRAQPPPESARLL